MTLEKGTLILADYTAKVKDTGQTIETTRKADAEASGNADPTRTYEPRLIAVGEGWVLKGLDAALEKSDAGQTLDVELTPENAFGTRDPNRVSRIPIRKFGEKAGDLTVGGEVEVDNRLGIIRSLESGRAIVDFNHKYAGKTLLYNVDIKEKLEGRDEKIRALIRRRLPVENEKVKFESQDSEVKITIPNDYFLLEGLQIIKRAISTDLFKFVKPLEKVEFLEDYENPASKQKPPEQIAPPTASEKESAAPDAKAATGEASVKAAEEKKEEEAKKPSASERHATHSKPKHGKKKAKHRSR